MKCPYCGYEFEEYIIHCTNCNAKIEQQDYLNSIIDKFNKQYPVLTVKKTDVFHDRFLIIDEKEVYHIGASIKDAGNKCFGISVIQDKTIANDLIKRLKTIK